MPDQATSRTVEDADGATVSASTEDRTQLLEERRLKAQAEGPEIADWWLRTGPTAEQKRARKQFREDVQTLKLDDSKQNDASEVSVHHVYRNALQTVAQLVPEKHAAAWKPRDEVDLVPGDEFNPNDQAELQIKQHLQLHDRQRKGFAECLTVAANNLKKKARFQEKIEAFVQDACHFPAAHLKTLWFEPGEDAQQVSEEKTPDTGSLMGRLAELAKNLVDGLFGASTPEMGEMRRTAEAAGKSVKPWAYGLGFELIPLDQCGYDGGVTGPERTDSARWWYHDIYLTDEEVLAEYDVEREELGTAATIYTEDVSGVAERKADELELVANTEGATYVKGNKQPVLRLVREIYDLATGQRLILINGVKRYVHKEDMHQFHRWRPPVTDLVMNRFPGRFYGLSDTQLQKKIAERINAKRTEAELAMDDSKPVYVYDKTVINDTDIDLVKDAAGRDWVGISADGKGIKDAFEVLVSSHQYNPLEYDTTKDEQELRKASALPEQATGVTGSGTADFAKELDIAEAAAGIQVRYRQARVKRALARIHDQMGNYIWNRCGPEDMVKLAGPLALRYWPEDLERRQQLYDELAVEVDIEMDQQIDAARRLDALTKLLQAAAAAGVRVDGELFARIFLKYLGEEETWDDLLRADPVLLIQRLQTALAEHPEDLSPEGAAALVEIAKQVIGEVAGGTPMIPPEAEGAGGVQLPGVDGGAPAGVLPDAGAVG